MRQYLPAVVAALFLVAVLSTCAWLDVRAQEKRARAGGTHEDNARDFRRWWR